MLFKRFITIAGLLFTHTILAQHCGWDGVEMFVVKVTDSAGKPIDNLKLTLLDSLGNPIVHPRNYYGKAKEYQKSDTLIFNQHLSEIDFSVKDHKNRPFQLAGKNYFAFSPLPVSPGKQIFYQIRIEDPSKTYYNQYKGIFSDALFDLCEDAVNDSPIVTFTLTRRNGLLFLPLNVIEIIKDKKKIESLENTTDYVKCGNFFIANYLDSTNTNCIGLFEKKGSRCIVYALTYNPEIAVRDFENGRLTFIDEYHYGSREHFEAEENFHIVDLKKHTAVSFKTFLKNENWSNSEDNKEDLEECKSTVLIDGNILTITKTSTEGYIEGFEGDCIEAGEYQITKEKLVRLTPKN